MASIIDDGNGFRRIQVVTPGGRKAIRLGQCSQRDAERILEHVEALAAAKFSAQSFRPATAAWLGEVGDTFYGRLARAGLVAAKASAQLGGFLDEYIKSRCDVKPATAIVLGHTRRNLIDYFKANKSLRDITSGEADQWRLSLIGQGLSDNTVRRRCGIAKQFLRAAMRQGLVASNPFADLKAAVQANRSREYFVSQQDAAKVLDACPDAQWRLLFALSRYGGLRCPSEHMALKWADVDWDKGRILVRSCKTEHHVGGESRMLPLFPELRPYLLEAFEEAEPGTEYIITRYRGAGVNLRTQLERIIVKAGLKPWPKLFQNLRATRETELAESWPEHVVTKWIGHTSAVARKHYLQVTDEHFAKAAQNPAQQVHADGRNASQEKVEVAICGQKRGDANQYDPQVGDKGLEPLTSAV